MASTTFVNGVTLTDAGWFNDVNRLQYTILNNPPDLATLKTTLGISNITYPLSIANGGTGQTTASAALAALGGLAITAGVANTTTVTGTNGVTGGGALSSNQTLSLDIHGLPVASPSNSDELAFYSISGAAPKKATISSIISAATQTTVSQRQTILSCPVDTNGNATYLPATSANNNLSTQNIDGTHPLIVTAAQGYGLSGDINTIGEATSTLTWTGLTASNTNYLYVTVGVGNSLTTGFTILAPVYSYVTPAAPSTGQRWFNMAMQTMMYWSGSAWTASPDVFVGYAVVDATPKVTSTVAYTVLLPRTWKTFNTTQRASGTTYYNTTGRDMLFCVSGTSSGTSGSMTITINGLNVEGNGWGNSVTSGISTTHIVPVGGSYSYTNSAYTSLTISEFS